MLSNEELKEYMQKVAEYMKNTDAQISQISMYLKEISNVFHSLLTIKQNGNYAMMEAAVIQFQITLKQFPQDIKSEIKQKLREILLNFSRELNIIAENLENLENGTIEIYKTISNLFLNIEKLFRLKDLTVTAYPRPQPFPM